jgi:lipoprotein signal peptidase
MRRLRLYVDDRGRLAMNEAGFSWLAAISLPLWALQRRLYVLAVAALVVGAAVNVGLDSSAQAIAFVLQFVAFGALANRLHRAYLERSGWRVTAEEPAPSSASPRR